MVSETVNAYMKGGPFNGAMVKFPRARIAPDYVFNINGQANYRMLNGPVLDAIQMGAECDHLAVTLEFVEPEAASA